MYQNHSQNNNTKRKKSSTVSFRIDRENEKILRSEAEQKRVSLNTLVNQIFGEYVEWQRYIERFGTIIMSKDAFRCIIGSLDEQEVINVAITIASKAPKEFILFKWKELSAKSVVNFMRMFFEHCGYGQYDYSKNQFTNTFSIHHDLGKKGSLFLKTYIQTIVKAALGKDCKSIITDDSIVVEFME